jgi:hypothetical protein
MSRALSILTAGDTSRSHELRDVLAQWIEAGILEPLLWIDADDRGLPDNERRGLWLSDEGPQELGVLAKVGDAPYPLLRLVAVQLITPDTVTPSDVLPGTDVEALLTRNRAASQQLVRVNLLVPTTGVDDVSAAWVQPLWDANVVASWEDRISNAHADRQVHAATNLVRHGALAAATMSGTWSGAAGGPFDDRPPVVGGGRTQLLVARTFGRVIRAGGIAEEISARLLGGAPEARVLATGAAPARDPERVASRAAEDFAAMDGGLLVFTPRPAQVGPKPRVVTVLTAFAMLFRYIWDRLRRAPHRIILGVKANIEGQLGAWAQSVTFGSDSAYQVRVGGRLTARDQEDHPLPDDATWDSLQVANAILEQMGAADTPPPLPRVWEGLRRTAFGLIDAGEMPEYVQAPVDGTTREAISTLTLVVPEPVTDPLHLRTVHLRIRPCDPYQALSIRTWLEEELQVAAADEDDEHAADLERDLAVLQAWVDRRAPSFVWRVGAAVAEEVATARSAFDDAVRRVASGPTNPDQQAADKARRGLRVRWILWLLLLLVGVGVAAFGPEFLPLASGAAVGIGVAAFVLWLIGSVLAFMAYQREMFRIAHAAERGIHSYTEAVYNARHDAVELLRLSALYDQLRDWAEIIGWMVHHPGGAEGDRHVADEDPPPVETPAALRVGVGRPSADMLMGATLRAARVEFRVGWLTKLFERYRTSSMAAVKLLAGLGDTAPDPDPDRDTVLPPTRLSLLEHLAEGRFSQEWRDEVRAGVVGVLKDLDPTALFSTVRVENGEDEDAGTMEAAEDFLSGLVPSMGSTDALSPSLWSPMARVERRDTVAETLLWIPEGLASSDAADRVQRLPVDPVRALDQHFAVEAIRLDLSEPCTPDSLEFMTPPTPWGGGHQPRRGGGPGRGRSKSVEGSDGMEFPAAPVEPRPAAEGVG